MIEHRRLPPSTRLRAALACAAALMLSSPAARAHDPNKDQTAYCGGKVVENPRVVSIFWGPNVNAQLQATITDYYRALLPSAFFGFLSEYSTTSISHFCNNVVVPTTNQTIHPGSVYANPGDYDGRWYITPQNRSLNLSETAVFAELQFQLDTGRLPPATDDMIYVFHFPPGITLSVNNGGSVACRDWQGYHLYTTLRNGQRARVVEMPDCPGFTLDTWHVVAAHELGETITDPETPDHGAWYAPLEIGDACGGAERIMGDDGAYYWVAQLWSNQEDACIVGHPAARDWLMLNRSTSEITEWVTHDNDPTSYTRVGLAGTMGKVTPGSSVFPGDFDGDGWGDLLVRDAVTHEVDIWFSNGPANLAMTKKVLAQNLFGGVPMPNDPHWQIAAVGDFVGNGNTGLFWMSDTGQTRTWSLQKSTQPGLQGTIKQQWDPRYGVAVESFWKVAGTGDFDGNGMTDLLWRNANNGDVGTWLMNGYHVGPTYASSQAGVESFWQVQGTGDFNGDGMTDVLWRNVNNGDIGIWQMRGGAIAVYLYPQLGVESLWQVQGVGDFNGDGTADVLWQNTNTAQLGVWQMSHGAISLYLYPGYAGLVGAMQPLGTLTARN